jgi:hypothetical protein
MAVPLLIAGTVVSAVSAISSGVQQSQSLNQQARAAEYNAQLSQNQATQAYASGVERESAQRRGAAQTLAEQRAALGASGVDATSGSALDVQLQSTRNAELDALQTRYEGILTGQNYEQQAAMGMYQAETLRSSATNARRSSYVTAAGNLLSGLGSAYTAGAKVGSPAPVVERSTYLG